MMSRLARLSRVALVLAMAAHAVELYQFGSFHFDKVNHVAATASWLQGRGFTIPDIAAGGLPHGVYRPLLGFLPGYALALAPLMRITHELWWSTYLLDIAAQSLFLVAWAALLRRATGQESVAGGLLVLWTVLYSPVATGTYSDVLAVSLFSAAVAAAALTVSRQTAGAWSGGIASALLMAATCAVRYAYWPLIVTVPVAIVIARRDRLAWTLAMMHVAIVAAAIGVASWYMQSSTGETVFLGRWYPDDERGFFWSHLRAVHPFAADALGFDRVYGLVASGRPLLVALTPVLLWGVSALVLTVVVAYVLNRARLWLDGRIAAEEAFLVVAGVATCAATVAMNIWLTLRLPAMSDGWTVAAEPRYYVPVLPFLGAFLWLVARDDRTSVPRVRAIAMALLILAAIVTIPVRLIRLNRYLATNVHTAWYSTERRAQADVILGAIRATADGDAPPLFIDDAPPWRRYVATMGGALVVDRAALKGCAGGHAPTARYLMAVPVAERGANSATRYGVAEDVAIIGHAGNPCAAIASIH